jgi:hypothetical protein
MARPAVCWLVFATPRLRLRSMLLVFSDRYAETTWM